MPRRASAGMNFHDARGTLVRVYPYAELRRDALAAAHRLIARGIEPGDRVAMIAETGAEFVALFFGALYAGVWPVPLPLADLVRRQGCLYRPARGPAEKRRSGPAPLSAPSWPMAGAAAEASRRRGPRLGALLRRGGRAGAALPKPSADDIAYLQYSSGSTRFPHGVVDHPPRAARATSPPTPIR